MNKANQITAQQAQTTNPLVNSENVVTEVVKILHSVDNVKPEVKLNETSISDGEGGRIELNNDKIVANDFEK